MTGQGFFWFAAQSKDWARIFSRGILCGSTSTVTDACFMYIYKSTCSPETERMAAKSPAVSVVATLARRGFVATQTRAICPLHFVAKNVWGIFQSGFIVLWLLGSY